jgi:hypothetical protein
MMAAKTNERSIFKIDMEIPSFKQVPWNGLFHTPFHGEPENIPDCKGPGEFMRAGPAKAIS